QEHRTRPPRRSGVGKVPNRRDSNAPSTGRKSASTLRRLVAQAEREVGDRERRRDELAAELSAAAGADPQRLADLGRRLADAQSELDAAEERWLVLAAEAEDAGAGL